MKFNIIIFCIILNNSIHAKEAWIEKSDSIATDYTIQIGNITPETASEIGLTEFDSKAVNISTQYEKINFDLNNKWLKKLDHLIKNEKQTDLKLDYQILKNKIEIDNKGIILNQKLGVIPFWDGSRFVYNNLFSIINSQSTQERKNSAVDRFKKYVRGDNSPPLLNSFKNVTNLKIGQNKKALYPLKNEIEQYLNDSDEYVNGIKELLQQSNRTDWIEDFNTFKEQVVNYNNFIKTSILPNSRTDFKLPREIYSYILKARGINKDPNWLIKTGKSNYQLLYKTFTQTADEIAKKHHLTSNKPIDVINFLKKDKVTSTQDAERVYQNINRELSDIIVKNELATLPNIPLKIRIAGDAESKANPIPHLVPPRLVGNNGERPEFVVPSSSTGELPFDDFSYKESAYILLAHEGRPGHDLQFSTMLDNGVSMIRSRYAFNNVNVEGWALYSEDLMFPYLSLEAKLPAIQMRLWRMARMFLDPEVQLGLAKKEDVIKVFHEELGVSLVLAENEFKRYTFQDPGQAPSYFYGLLKIKEAKDVFKKKNKLNFTEKCFNDSLLKQGLLPLDMIREKLIKLKCK